MSERVAHLPTGTGSEALDLGSAYRYVRFNVEAAQNNPTGNGDLCFTWAELRPMEEESIDCLSNLYRFIFSGTYTGVSAASQRGRRVQRVYIIGGGEEGGRGEA